VNDCKPLIIGGTELLSPGDFISQLARLNGGGFNGGGTDDDEIDLDDLIIE
jgi:hypothetical protein